MRLQHEIGVLALNMHCHVEGDASMQFDGVFTLGEVSYDTRTVTDNSFGKATSRTTMTTQLALAKQPRSTSTSSSWRDDVSSLGGAESAKPESTITSDSDFDEDTTTTRIHFSGVTIVGREEELQHLQNAWNRILQGQSEVIMVSGMSGTGKSTLVESFRKQVTFESNGFFVAGKFDQLRNEPLSAVVEAFSDLCDLVAQECTFDQRKSIVEQLEIEHQVLINLLPSLHRIDPSTDTDGTSANREGDQSAAAFTSMSSSSGKDMFARFKLACQRFLRATSSPTHPVLLFLDDIQWADETSIQVIQSLVADTESRNVLIVCTYRSNFEDYSNNMVPLLEMVGQGASDSDGGNGDDRVGFDSPRLLRVSSLSLSDLDLTSLDRLLSALLTSGSQETESLSEIVLRRTNGNPYYIVQFIHALELSEMLWFSQDRGMWEWDLERIQADTTVSENVGELLISRIQNLPDEVQFVLKVASCLGHRFESSLLCRVFEGLPQEELEAGFITEPFKERTEMALVQACELGFVERVPQRVNVLAFTHDRVHQCLYDMIPVGNEAGGDNVRARLHLSIAKSLSRTTTTYRDALVCAVADQYNRAEALIRDHATAEVGAQSNLDAAKVAIAKSAIPVASEYVRQGVAILDKATNGEEGSSPWSRNYALALELYTTAAQVHFCSGDFDGCQSAVQEVERHARSHEDSLSARSTLAFALGGKGDLMEAVELLLALVREHGHNIPKKPGIRHVITEFIKTRRLLNGMTDEELLQQEPNEHDSRFFPLLGQAAEYASLAYKIKHLCISVFKVTQIAVTKRSATSPVFAAYGVVLSVMGNYDEAYRFGQLSMKLQEAQGDPRTLPRAYPLIYMFFNHWKHPLQDFLEPLRYSYEMGMATGEVEGGFMAIQTYVALAFHCGRPLDEVEAVHRLYCRQMCEFNHRSKALLALCYWQLCLNLMGMQGSSSSPHLLDGEAIRLREFEMEANSSGNILAQQSLTLTKLILSYLASDQLGLQGQIERLELPSKIGSHFLIYCGSFHFCLCLLEVCRHRPRSRYRRMIRGLYRLLQNNVKKGNRNCEPLANLVNAEIVSQRRPKKVGLVKTLYDAAILDCSSQELLHVEAIAHERAAKYLFEQQRFEEARPYMVTCLGLFEEWGATIKVEQLVARYPTVFLKDTGNRHPMNVATPPSSD